MILKATKDTKTNKSGAREGNGCVSAKRIENVKENATFIIRQKFLSNIQMTTDFQR